MPTTIGLHVVLLVCVLMTTIDTSLSSPVSRYDQRQEGETNIRANVDNFIVLIIPASADGIGASLFNLLLSAKHNAKANHAKVEDKISHGTDVFPKAIAFNDEISLKPNHIVLSTLHTSTKSVDFPTVASVRLDTKSIDSDDDVPAVEITFDQVQKALSPKTLAMPPTQEPLLAVKQATGEQGKKAKAISATLQTSSKSAQKAKAKERNVLEERVKLLNADLEICSPEERRDEDGNCEPITPKHRNGPHAFSGGLTPDILGFGLSPATD